MAEWRAAQPEEAEAPGGCRLVDFAFGSRQLVHAVNLARGLTLRGLCPPVEDAAAQAAAIGGSVVGVAGVYFGWLSSRGQRRHAERLAAGQHDHERRIARGRLFDLRAEAYEELDGHLQRVMLVLERTHPIMGPRPPPPPSPSDDEWLAMRAKVGVLGSHENDDGVRVVRDEGERVSRQRGDAQPPGGARLTGW